MRKLRANESQRMLANIGLGIFYLYIFNPKRRIYQYTELPGVLHGCET